MQKRVIELYAHNKNAGIILSAGICDIIKNIQVIYRRKFQEQHLFFLNLIRIYKN